MIQMDKVRITEELLLDISEIEAFRGRFPYLRKDHYYLDLMKAQARITGTAASVRIEGNLLKDYEVERVLGGVSSPSYREKDVIEARAYADALDYINEHFEVLELSERNIKKLHSMIVENSESGYRTSIKPQQNIQSDEPDMLHVKASEIPKMTIELLSETETLLKSRSHHPLIIIALFLVHFLTINPFEEGNGRLSRLLSALLLQRNGYSFIKCYPFESIIEESRKTYLYAIRRTQQSFSDSTDYSSWLNYFIKTIMKVCTKLEARMTKEEAKDEHRIELSPIEKDIIEKIKDSGMIYTSTLLESLGQYKAPTIKKALSRLVKEEMIQQLGKARGTYYKVLG